jgi:hypothetical protein
MVISQGDEMVPSQDRPKHDSLPDDYLPLKDAFEQLAAALSKSPRLVRLALIQALREGSVGLYYMSLELGGMAVLSPSAWAADSWEFHGDDEASVEDVSPSIIFDTWRMNGSFTPWPNECVGRTPAIKRAEFVVWLDQLNTPAAPHPLANLAPELSARPSFEATAEPMQAAATEIPQTGPADPRPAIPAQQDLENRMPSEFVQPEVAAQRDASDRADSFAPYSGTASAAKAADGDVVVDGNGASDKVVIGEGVGASIAVDVSYSVTAGAETAVDRAKSWTKTEAMINDVLARKWTGWPEQRPLSKSNRARDEAIRKLLKDAFPNDFPPSAQGPSQDTFDRFFNKIDSASNRLRCLAERLFPPTRGNLRPSQCNHALGHLKVDPWKASLARQL